MNDSMDRTLADWLRDGPDTGPREGLERTLAATRRTGQRPGWTFVELWLPSQLTTHRRLPTRPLLYLAVLGLLVAALAAVTLIVGSQRRLADPFGIARNGAVVYVRDNDLLIADRPGGAERVLLAGPGRDHGPVFSNRGDRIAFMREDPEGVYRLMTVRADGSDLRDLGGGFLEAGVQWSPDGTALLVGHDYPVRRLAIVNADGSGTRELELGASAGRASWRPDGRQIAVGGEATDAGWSYLIEADGSNLRRLELPSRAGGLSWSPDGTRLVFTIERRYPPPTDRSGSRRVLESSIANVDADGLVTRVERLASVPGWSGEIHPVWSPDGSQIAYIAFKDGWGQVMVASPDGSGDVRSIGPAWLEESPVGIDLWSPDGRSLLIRRLRGADPEAFWLLDVGSGAQTKLDVPVGSVVLGLDWQRLAP